MTTTMSTTLVTQSSTIGPLHPSSPVQHQQQQQCPMPPSSSSLSSVSSFASACEHQSLIRRQFMKIESLETELSMVRSERDALLGENERLHFQLQCIAHSQQQQQQQKCNGCADTATTRANNNAEADDVQQRSGIERQKSISMFRRDVHKNKLNSTSIGDRTHALDREEEEETRDETRDRDRNRDSVGNQYYLINNCDVGMSSRALQSHPLIDSHLCSASQQSNKSSINRQSISANHLLFTAQTQSAGLCSGGVHHQQQHLLHNRQTSSSSSNGGGTGSTGGGEHSYELSQQLIDRRVSVLERKYGGLVARESATRIQRAFRTYRLQKRFKTIAIQALRLTASNQNQNNQKNEKNDCNSEQQKHESSSLSDTQSTRSDDSSGGNGNVFIPESLLSSVSSSGGSSSGQQTTSQQLECVRKRHYRVGLNLFNKHPSERGVQYLLRNGFIEQSEDNEVQAQVIARFLLTRKGVSKAMIGEYIATNAPFNQLVLQAFVREIDLCHMQVDSALRKFQTFYRFPGEAQKIERLVDAFATRYIECNANNATDCCLSRDSVFILAFAIIMLNTDLHTPTNARNRMTGQQWLQNLNGVFAEGNLAEQFLLDIYHRIKNQELRTGADHVTQVSKVQSAIVARDRSSVVPNLCAEWRRLVCYCRLYEVQDKSRKRKPEKNADRHQREVFLFNDLLLITKLSARAKSSHQMPEYVFREAISLEGLSVQLFSNHFQRFGILLRRRHAMDFNCPSGASASASASTGTGTDQAAVVLSLNARNELDQKRFCDDLKESILEVVAMETIRITKSNSLLALNTRANNNNSAYTTSGVATSGATPMAPANRAPTEQKSGGDGREETEQQQIRRKSSSGSLDSGLSLPSRDHSPQTTAAQQQQQQQQKKE